MISWIALGLAILNLGLIIWGEIERHQARKEQQ